MKLPKSPKARSRVFGTRATVLATAVATSLGLLGPAQPVWAAPLVLVQQPPGKTGVEPAPNVIISVDDSGSMAWEVGGGDHTAKMTGLKAALLAQFGDANANPPTKGLVEDGRIRLAWQTMWSPYYPGGNTLTPGANNSMKSFTGTHRQNFSTFVNSLTPWDGTPSHQMMKNVRDYMRTPEGLHSPFADQPGVTQSTPYAACRRTYHIFMTDGEWNSEGGITGVGNVDGTMRTLPDGKLYDPIGATAPTVAPQVRIYADPFGAGNPSTLADWAFYNWATDFQDGNNGTQNIPNNIQPRIRKAGAELIGGALPVGQVVEEYWNAKNNPMTWQGVTQFTIGFGTGATSWGGQPTWDSTTDDNYGGGYPNVVRGATQWVNTLGGNRTADLWHMALNGRGKFYPARSAAALSAAFADILDNVIADTSPPLVSVSTNSSRVTGSTKVYAAGYVGGEWKGYLKAFNMTPTGMSATENWDSGTLLDAKVPGTRVILTHNGTTGIPFRWGSLPNAAPATQRALLNASDNRGSDRLDYLRGDRSSEGAGPSSFRARTSVLGDLVNSNLWYLDRPTNASKLLGYSTFASTNASRAPMLYIGGNDGMLHGFDAVNGQERIAYVPIGAYTKIAALTQQGFVHRYIVDGSPFTGDVQLTFGAPSSWRTYLAGFMGAGGPGYFVLDVTNPSAASFTESNAAALVVLDKTDTVGMDPDIGNIFSQPALHPASQKHAVQFTMMNNNRPALILGNGVNSANERPVLLIQYLDGAKEVFKLVASASTGTGNGLMNPQVIDLNSDGKADFVYAGDLQGNLWKFDLTDSSSAAWKVSFGGAPLYTALDSGGSPQPIQVAPVWLPHPKGGIQLGFGTGRLMTFNDRTDVSEQTFYSVWDKTPVTYTANVWNITDLPANRITTGRSALVQQTMGNVAIASLSPREFFNSSSNPVNYSSVGANNNRRGWYMNFSTKPGERATLNADWAGGDYTTVYSAVPASGTGQETETCSVSSKNEIPYKTNVDLISGAAPSVPIYDTTGSGISESDAPANKVSYYGEGVSFNMGNNRILSVDGKNSPLAARRPAASGLTTGWAER